MVATIEERNQILNSLTLNMPEGCEKDPSFVALIWQALKNNHSKSLGADHIYDEIEPNLRGYTGDDECFKKRVDLRTLQKFLKNFREPRGTLIPNLKTLKQVVAYLVLDSDSPMTLDDIRFKTFNNKIAQNLSIFMGSHEPEPEDLKIEALVGIYETQKDLGQDIDHRQLYIQASDDGTHFLATELRQIKNKKSQFNHDDIASYDGYGCVTYSGELIFFMTRVKSGGIYSAFTMGIDGENKISKLQLLITDKAFNIDNDLSDQVLNKTYLFEKKTADILTFSLPNNDKTRADIMLQILATYGGSRSAAEDYATERMFITMDEAEKQRLGKELLELLEDESHCPDAVIELIEKGAPLDYQHPKTKFSPLHHLACSNVEFYQAAIDHSPHEINFLVRDRNDYLPSAWAADVVHFAGHDTYNAIKANEIAAGNEKGVIPWVTREVPLGGNEPK